MAKKKKHQPAQTPAVLARLEWVEAALLTIADQIGADLPPPPASDAGPVELPAPPPTSMAYRAKAAAIHVARFSGTARLRAEDLHRSWKATGSPLPFPEFAKLNGLG